MTFRLIRTDFDHHDEERKTPKRSRKLVTRHPTREAALREAEAIVRRWLAGDGNEILRSDEGVRAELDSGTWIEVTVKEDE